MAFPVAQSGKPAVVFAGDGGRVGAKGFGKGALEEGTLLFVDGQGECNPGLAAAGDGGVDGDAGMGGNESASDGFWEVVEEDVGPGCAASGSDVDVAVVAVAGSGPGDGQLVEWPVEHVTPGAGGGADGEVGAVEGESSPGVEEDKMGVVHGSGGDGPAVVVVALDALLLPELFEGGDEGGIA